MGRKVITLYLVVDIVLFLNNNLVKINIEKNEQCKSSENLIETERAKKDKIDEINNVINRTKIYHKSNKSRNDNTVLDNSNSNTDSKINSHPMQIPLPNKNVIESTVNNKYNSIIIKGIIQCDLPNPSLYTLNGKANMRLNGLGNEFPLDAKNLLLKGAKLRNTEWIIGIVIYTGHNCKLMKNAKDPIIKMSSVESLLNKLLLGILFLQIILSIISCICHSIYYDNHEIIIIASSTINEYESSKNTWIDYLPFNLGIDSTLSFFTYLLLLNTMIPISLIITLELVKIIQGLFIGVDAESYSFTRKKYIRSTIK